MQRHIEIEYDKLRNRIVKMGSLVDEQVRLSLKALLDGDLNAANMVIEMENKIDDIDVKIDKLCQRIFALTQPVASDLRFIMATLKIDNDLERVGDIAVSIAKKVETVKDYIEVINKVKLNDYSAYSEKMIKEAIDCYVNKDLALAIDILKKSNIIHDVGQKIFNDILSEMQNDPKIIVGATNLVLILRHIERLKDHATNIAEDVVFMIEGKIVKHSRISENLEDGLIQ